MSQNEYAASIDELYIPDDAQNDQSLTKEQSREYRAATGKLLWLSEQTRPDLSYDSINMSCKNKTATIKDMREANKIIKKAKNLQQLPALSKVLGSIKLQQWECQDLNLL